jgi:hypothetical protein
MAAIDRNVSVGIIVPTFAEKKNPCTLLTGKIIPALNYVILYYAKAYEGVEV